MPRGRRPSPHHLKLIKGTFRPDRIRRVVNADRSLGKPPPPTFLSAEAREEWDRQCDPLYAAGMLTALDGAALAAYCQSYGRWRQAEKLLSEMVIDNADEASKGLLTRAANGKLVPHPLAAIANKAMQDTMRYAAELGLTPISRSRVDPEPPPRPDGDDPAQKYLD